MKANLKYSNLPLETKIRAYDFFGMKDHYVVGVIKADLIIRGVNMYSVLVTECTYDDDHSRVGEEILVPHETMMDDADFERIEILTIKCIKPDTYHISHAGQHFL